MKELILNDIDNNLFDCVMYSDGLRVYNAHGKGIKPLYDFCADAKKYSELYAGDKVVGRGAALLLAHMQNVKYVYAFVMSKNAVEVLQKYGIEYSCSVLVNEILNRDLSALCPVEALSAKATDPYSGVALISEFLNSVKR